MSLVVGQDPGKATERQLNSRQDVAGETLAERRCRGPGHLLWHRLSRR